MPQENRHDLPFEALNGSEQRERVCLTELYEKAKEAGLDKPLTECARRNMLHANFTAEKRKAVDCYLSRPATVETQAADSKHQTKAWEYHAMLIEHSKNCPLCVVFPQEVPYMKNLPS